MAQAIDFLVRHSYLVIVVVWLVYAMFFRRSPLEKPRHPADRMPDFGGGGFPRPPIRRAQQPPASRRPGERPAAPPHPGEPARPVRADRRAPWPGAETAPPRPADGAGRQPLPRAPQADAAAPAVPPRAEARAAGGEGAAPPAVPGGALFAAAAAPPPAAAGPSVAAPPPAGAASAGWTRAELARAVVMAEVLGPPRARKPFRPR